jgi:hypothetical protein
MAHPLDYLNNKPEIVWWDVVAPIGARLSVLQDHDLIYDEYDRRIRKLPLEKKEKKNVKAKEK